MPSRFLDLKTAFAAIKGGRPEEAPFTAETFLTKPHKNMDAAACAEIASHYGELMISLDERTQELAAKHIRAHMLTCGEAAAGHFDDMTTGLTGDTLTYMRGYQRLHLLERFLATPLEPHWNTNYNTPDEAYETFSKISTGMLLTGIRNRAQGGGPTAAQAAFMKDHGLTLEIK